MIPHILINEYTYDLPQEKIAFFSLPNRDKAKLLVFHNPAIEDAVFCDLANYLPEHTLLVCNNSKVFPARLLFNNHFSKPIEIFCMELLQQTCNSAIWKGMIGGNAQWKNGILSQKKNNILLQVERIAHHHDGTFTIQLQWDNVSKNIFEILDLFGHTPLPPYIKRAITEKDKNTYQTIFAYKEGSVAAPTAGLHFTQHVLQSLQQKNIDTLPITLHVGGGTFLPIKVATISQHIMHTEQVVITKNQIEKLIQQIETKKPIAAVGTTSLRSLESLYSLGIMLLQNKHLDIHNIEIPQWLFFESSSNLSYADSLNNILQYLHQQKTDILNFKTTICIVPGYTIQSANYLITNFHQPYSTLILLVAACIGDKWKKVYKHALESDYRFLSYGDVSLLSLQS